jgi:hypothetical protein
VTKHILAVFSNPVEGRQEEYETWYSQRHIFDLLKVPGITGARLFSVVPEEEPMGPGVKQRYLAIYEIEGADIAHVLPKIQELKETGDMPVSDAIILPAARLFYREIASTKRAAPSAPPKK